MKKAIETMIQSVKNAIINDTRDVCSVKGDKVLKMVLAAYNDYQENERDGVDYIFDLNNQDDLKCCIDGGMTAKEISRLYLGSRNDHLPYFYFGCNYPKPQPINTWYELRTNLIAWLDDVLPCVLAYPYAVEAYKVMYRFYVTDVVIDYPSEWSLTDIDALAALKRKMETMG